MLAGTGSLAHVCVRVALSPLCLHVPLQQRGAASGSSSDSGISGYAARYAPWGEVQAQLQEWEQAPQPATRPPDLWPFLLVPDRPAAAAHAAPAARGGHLDPGPGGPQAPQRRQYGHVGDGPANPVLVASPLLNGGCLEVSPEAGAEAEPGPVGGVEPAVCDEGDQALQSTHSADDDRPDQQRSSGSLGGDRHVGSGARQPCLAGPARGPGPCEACQPQVPPRLLQGATGACAGIGRQQLALELQPKDRPPPATSRAVAGAIGSSLGPSKPPPRQAKAAAMAAMQQQRQLDKQLGHSFKVPSQQQRPKDIPVAGPTTIAGAAIAEPADGTAPPVAAAAAARLQAGTGSARQQAGQAGRQPPGKECGSKRQRPAGQDMTAMGAFVVRPAVRALTSLAHIVQQLSSPTLQ